MFPRRRRHDGMADQLPPDPEAEALAALRADFLSLGFTEGEARKLAAARADPVRVSWWLEQGCTHRRAVQIAT